MPECLIESHDVDGILLLVEEIGNQLFYPIYLPFFAHKWKVVMEIVKVLGIRHTDCQEVTFIKVPCQLTDVALKLIWFAQPFEPTSWMALAHRPTIKIICIQVLKVMTLFPSIKPFIHVLIVRPHIGMNCLRNATLCVSLKH